MAEVRDGGLEMQRDVTRTALRGVEDSGFALAGSGAIREHGVIARPTNDIDLFTTRQYVDRFGGAVDRVGADLRQDGYHVEEARRAPEFARLFVRRGDGAEVAVDMGVDWRAESPVRLSVGPVLALDDAVGNKVSALYSRAEARDYLDVDAIRASGRYSDSQLLRGAADRDPGFDSGMFAQQLDAGRRIKPADVAQYGVTPDQLEGVQARSAQWARDIRGQAAGTANPQISDRARASFPAPSNRTVPDPVTAARRSPSSPVARDSGPER